MAILGARLTTHSPFLEPLPSETNHGLFVTQLILHFWILSPLSNIPCLNDLSLAQRLGVDVITNGVIQGFIVDFFVY